MHMELDPPEEDTQATSVPESSQAPGATDQDFQPGADDVDSNYIYSSRGAGEL